MKFSVPLTSWVQLSLRTQLGMKRLEGTCRCGSRRRRIEVNKSLSLVTVCELLSVELNESFSILYASDCGSVKYIYLY